MDKISEQKIIDDIESCTDTELQEVFFLLHRDASYKVRHAILAELNKRNESVTSALNAELDRRSEKATKGAKPMENKLATILEFIAFFAFFIGMIVLYGVLA